MDSDEEEETGKECIFPFQFNGNIHNECTWDQAAPGNPWCSTKVDENGVHIENIDEWGICGEGCPIARKGNAFLCYGIESILNNSNIMFR